MDFGIVYHIENAHQFWDELQDILRVDSREELARIDNSIKTFINFCAQYHELYLQTSLQLEHACSLLLESDIFSWHSERLSNILLATASQDTNPHCELIVHSTLLIYGRRNAAFLRSKQKWKPIFLILMDHILVEMDDDFGGNVDLSRGPGNASGMGIPIEARLRSLAIGILYEACRVQKFNVEELRVFDDHFVERLFDLVELTRNVDDESLNYSVIKLIVALSEQFMVAAAPSTTHDQTQAKRKKEHKNGPNRILDVLIRRVHSSKTFGENIIFMLNRASNTEEDLVMQLLLLKMLYILFTTPGTQRYFYTNDLRVLVDVFLRELTDLPEESEALRHTYLRVLNPLLTNTQLRELPYKGHQVRRTLQSLISNPNMREVTPTTKRLVERCLHADWCINLPEEADSHVSPPSITTLFSSGGPINTTNGYATHSQIHLASSHLSDDDILEPPQPAFRFKTLHKSVSAEVLQPPPPMSSPPPVPALPNVHITSNPDRAKITSPISKRSINGSLGSSSSHQTAALDMAHHRPPPAIPNGSAPRTRTKSTATSPPRIERPAVSNAGETNGTNGARRPSLGSVDHLRNKKPPPPVPTTSSERSSLDSRLPPFAAGTVTVSPAMGASRDANGPTGKASPPLVNRREPPAIPSKAKKPKSKGSGTISDSPLSKLAYSAATAR